MPTFFGRRYMRGQPSATERAIGWFCLALSVAILAGFAWYAVQPREPFFRVREESRPPVVSIESQFARALLPPTPAPGWTLDADHIEIYAGDAMSRPLGEDAASYTVAGVRRLFDGRYQNRNDSRQQLTVRIFETDGPQAAQTLFDRLRPKDAVGEGVGQSGWRVADGAIGFRAGRYYTHVFANDPARGAALTPQLLAREVATRQVAYDADQPTPATTNMPTSIITASTPAKTPDNSPLPADPSNHWSGPLDVTTFNPANLWEKINGRAEAYLAYDFQRLVFATYRLRGKSTASADCYQFEMADPTKAMGIYQAERPEHPDPAKVGKEGYAGEGAVFFHKGKAYVQLIASEAAAGEKAALLALAQTLAAAIPEEAESASAESLLPTADRIEGSLEYAPKDALSQDFLTDVFMAKYETPAGPMSLFITRASDPAAAQSLYEKYLAAMADLDGKAQNQASGDGWDLTEIDLDGEYDIIFHRGPYFSGVNAATDLPEGRRRAEAFLNSLEGR